MATNLVYLMEKCLAAGMAYLMETNLAALTVFEKGMGKVMAWRMEKLLVTEMVTEKKLVLNLALQMALETHKLPTSMSIDSRNGSCYTDHITSLWNIGHTP